MTLSTLVSWSTFFVLAAPLAAQSQKLNLPLPLGARGGYVGQYHLAPDDSRIAYLALEAGDQRQELRSLRLDGSQPAQRMSDGVPSAERLHHDFQISPDSTRVFFFTTETHDTGESVWSLTRLYGVALDGSSRAKRLAEGDLGPSSLRISPDGTWLVYEANDPLDEVGVATELYSVPADGHRDPIRILASNDGYEDRHAVVAGGRVVFFEALGTNTVVELFSMAPDGSARVRLNAPLPADGDVVEFEVSADATRVVYRAEQAADRVYELFSVPLDGSAAPARLNGTLVPGGDVQRFDLSPDSTHVAYIANQDRADVRELYVAPLDGSGAAVKVSGALGTGREVQDGARFSLDSARVVYRADALQNEVYQLFSAPRDASSGPVPLSGPLVPGGDVADTWFQSEPHVFLGAGNTVVYLADAVTDGKFELCSAPLDGSAPPTRLSGTLAPQRDVLDFELSADGSRAVFRADVETDQRFDLYAVPVSGAQAPSKLNQVSRRPDTPFGFLVRADGSEVFFGEIVDTPMGDLYRRPSDASAPATKVNGPLGAPGVQGDVHSILEDPVSGRVVYRADQDVDESEQLVSVRTDGAPEHVRLGDPTSSSYGIEGLRTVRGTALFIRRSATGAELFSAPVDGGSAPVSLTPPLVHPLVGFLTLPPDGSRVVFVAGPLSGGPPELYSVLVDGSTAPVKLSGAIVQYGGVGSAITFTPDGLRVVYSAEAETDGVQELYVVPIDGGVAPVRISGTLVAGGDVVASYYSDGPPVTPDSRLALFRADAELDERFELYAAATDGSTPRMRVSGPLAANGDVQSAFALSADGTRAVYRADASVDERFELYSVPLDGSASPVRINGALAPSGDVLELALSPDGTRVVYRADADGDELVELFVTTLAGHAHALRLDAPGYGSVRDFQIDPRAERVVYLVDPLAEGGIELHSAPLDASRAARRLDAGLQKDGNVQWFQISPDGELVVYLADQDLDEVFELFSVPIDGRRRATRKNERLPTGREVRTFQISADGNRVYYIADQDENDVMELYQAFLRPPLQSAPRLR